MSENIKILNPGGSRILVHMKDGDLDLPRCKTALQLLEVLGLGEEMALVIRGDQLLTPDRRIWPNDEITIRVVASKG